MPPEPTQGSTPAPPKTGSLMPTLKSLDEYAPSAEIKEAVAQFHAVGKNQAARQVGAPNGNFSGTGKPTG